MQGREQTIEDLKFAHYLQEIYLDSDTKVACISGSPSQDMSRLVPHQRNEGRTNLAYGYVNTSRA